MIDFEYSADDFHADPSIRKHDYENNDIFKLVLQSHGDWILHGTAGSRD